MLGTFVEHSGTRSQGRHVIRKKTATLCNPSLSLSEAVKRAPTIRGNRWRRQTLEKRRKLLTQLIPSQLAEEWRTKKWRLGCYWLSIPCRKKNTTFNKTNAGKDRRRILFQPPTKLVLKFLVGCSFWGKVTSANSWICMIFRAFTESPMSR